MWLLLVLLLEASPPLPPPPPERRGEVALLGPTGGQPNILPAGREPSFLSARIYFLLLRLGLYLLDGCRTLVREVCLALAVVGLPVSDGKRPEPEEEERDTEAKINHVERKGTLLKVSLPDGFLQ